MHRWDVAVLTLVWWGLFPAQVTEFFGKRANPALLLLLIPLILTCLPDYLSLLETRYIIRCIGNRYSLVRVCLFLLCDYVLTWTIFLFFCVFIIIFASYFTPLPLQNLSNLELYKLFTNSWYGTLVAVFIILSGPFILLHNPTGISFPIQVFIFSVFFTSVWVWLYGLAGAIVRAEQTFGWFINILINYGIIDTDKKPLEALGMISAIIVTVLYILSTVLLWAS